MCRCCKILQRKSIKLNALFFNKTCHSLVITYSLCTPSERKYRKYVCVGYLHTCMVKLSYISYPQVRKGRESSCSKRA